MAQDDAASLLVRAMSDDKIPFTEKRRVAEFLLTYESRHEVHVTLDKWQQDIEGVLVGSDDDDVVDAEIVDDPELSPASPRAEHLLPSLLTDPPRHTRPGPRLR